MVECKNTTYGIFSNNNVEQMSLINKHEQALFLHDKSYEEKRKNFFFGESIR